MAELLKPRGLVAVLPAVLSLSCAGPQQPVQPPSADEVVVATVGGSRVTLDEVRARLPQLDSGPRVLRPGDRPAAVWHSALDLAIQDELLALEAEARQLKTSGTGSRASKIRAVMQDELTHHPGHEPDSIDSATARRWYAEHAALFAEVRSATATWARFTDPGRARQALGATPGLGVDEFVRRARELGAVAVGTDALDESGRGTDDMVARAVFAVRDRGGVGLVAGRRRSWLVRVDRMDVSTPAWGTEMAYRVRAVIGWRRQQRHLRLVADRLAKQWAVVRHAGRLPNSAPPG